MATVAQRQDPLLGFNFLVSIMDSQPSSGARWAVSCSASPAGRQPPGFQEISGLDVTMEVENYEAGGFNTGALRFPGRIKWANLVFKRGVLATSTPRSVRLLDLAQDLAERPGHAQGRHHYAAG